jgi:acetylornithine/succinyldiaminopimelate/putrescine aminotransferase/GNAT superfamily N-acetyltransferase
MKLPLINAEDAKQSLEVLKKYYENHLIPAEKKTYLTDLKNSIGPYMGVTGSDGKTHYFLDAASQIATLGHGFNTSVFFGTGQFLESWTNDSSTKEFKEMRSAFQNFFHRKLNWKKTFLTFVHSGAEANEMALGYCYQSRVHKNANKVLAFEGSFHGRMMITLMATWNKSKREPFEWQNYLAEYVPYPELENSKIHREMPSDWKSVWNESSLIQFKIPEKWIELGKKDPSIQKEIEVLLKVREKLSTKTIFSIIVEPMQCEGGDCYSSDRFQTALILMAKTFKVPVIHDEVQTGFHLGKEFFWHREFNLTGLNGEQLNPDYVTCAKKAQIGVVLSHKETKNIFKGEEFSVASAFRGYAHAISLDQAQIKIKKLEEIVKTKIDHLISDNPNYIERPRINGLAFAFDLKDPSLLNKCVDLRFKHGLLYYPAGSKTLRFRLNTSFADKDIEFLFNRLDAILKELYTGVESKIPLEVETDNIDSRELYEWHQFLINAKIEKLHKGKLDSKDVMKKLALFISSTNSKTELIEIKAQNFLEHRESIIELEKKVYEPARQTDIEKFEHTVLNKNSLCLGVIADKKLIGIAFAGPLKLYPLERGVRIDPHFNDEDCLYMLDVTIAPEYHGSGLGRSLKYALSALALTKGVKKIQGRNRDRLAQAMININLSLGAIEQNYMREDYPDFESHRDVFYYTTKADWKKSSHQLSTATTMPLTSSSLDAKYIEKQMPFIVNKICLSNFVSETFIKNVKNVFQALPINLQHGYTCSGQSECVDKVIKSIWVKSDESKKKSNTTKILTFKGHYFGNGSNLSRSLSYDTDPYFDVIKAQNPNEKNYIEVLKEVEEIIKNNSLLAIAIEPMLQKSMEKVPYEFLRGLKKLSNENGIALIYNETASSLYRFSIKNCFASNFQEIEPDAGILYTSGQSGLVFTSEKYFLDAPLMLISTWDGDEFSFNTFYEAFELVQNNKDQYFLMMKEFHKKIIDQLSRFEMDIIKLENGFGFFKGSIPASMEKMFKRYENDYYVVAPSFGAMKEYLNS